MAVTPFQLTELFSMDNFNSRISEINTMFNGLGNEYVWSKTKSEYVEKLYAQPSGYPYYIVSPFPANMPYSDSVAFNDDGSVYLVNPQTYTITSDNYSTAASFLSGKYIDTTNTTTSSTPVPGITKLPANSVFVKASSSIYLKNYTDDNTIKIFVGSKLQTVNYGYVNSPNQNAYPPAVSDGYTYTPLGQIGSKAQIATGSYTGTGTYGSSNKNSLTFDFEPKLVFVWSNGGENASKIIIFCGCTYYMGVNDSGNELSYGDVSVSGNTVYWYSSSKAQTQCNYSGNTYDYLAIS